MGYEGLLTRVRVTVPSAALTAEATDQAKLEKALHEAGISEVLTPDSVMFFEQRSAAESRARFLAWQSERIAFQERLEEAVETLRDKDRVFYAWFYGILGAIFLLVGISCLVYPSDVKAITIVGAFVGLGLGAPFASISLFNSTRIGRSYFQLRRKHDQEKKLQAKLAECLPISWDVRQAPKESPTRIQALQSKLPEVKFDLHSPYPLPLSGKVGDAWGLATLPPPIYVAHFGTARAFIQA